MRRATNCLIAIGFLLSCTDSGTPAKTVDSKEELLKNAVINFPDSFLLVENLIQYYREAGNYSQALNITNDQLKKDSTLLAWWNIKATLHYENGDTVSAINSFEKAVSIEPSPEILISLGALYAQVGDPKALLISDALKLADKAKVEKEALFIKGLYYNYSGQKQKAIPFFDACLQLDYTYMFAYREKGIALYDLARYADALKVLEKAVTLQNSFEEGYFWIGRCYEKLGRPAEARDAYRKAVMYDKDYVEAKDALIRMSK